MALEVSHHGYLLVTHLTTQEHCCHISFHAYLYMNVMRSSRLFRASLFLEKGSILMIWGCFSIVSNVIRSNYCCRRHTVHGNMVFSRDSIFPTPQQSGCLLGCSVDCISRHFRSIRNFFFTKWLPAAILDDRKSLSIAFLGISDQCATLIFFHKMAAGGHFG